MDLFAEFKALIGKLEKRGVDYAICGGLAMAIHGLPRATVDIDLLVPEAAVEALTGLAKESGYETEARPMALAGGKVKIRRFTKTDPSAGDALSLDLVIATPAIADAWSSRERAEWEGGALWVVSREGLIHLKSLRGSGQDEDDIRFLREGDDRES